MTNKYAKAYVEVIEILKTLPNEEYNKIPKEKIEFYESNKDSNYIFHVDMRKEISEQNISREANAVLINLFRDFFANDNQKEKLKRILSQNEVNIEEEKQEKYNSDNIFNKKQKNIIEEEYNQNELIEYKETIFRRILNKIKAIFNIK